MAQITPPPGLPDFPDLDDETIELLLCIGHAAAEIDEEIAEGAAWILDLWNTVFRLIEQRRRCQEMTNSVLQSACMATWTAQTLFEANRLRHDLSGFVEDEVATRFFEHFLSCFGVDPDAPPRF